MAGLDFLYSPVSQTYRAGQQMIQDSLSNQKEALFNDRYQQMTPLEVTHQDLANQETQARIPGVQGQSASLQAQGQVDQAMAPTKIAVGQSTGQVNMDDNQVKLLSNYGQKLGMAGRMIDQLQAGPATPSVLPNVLSKVGLSPDDPIVQKVMEHGGQVPVQNLGKYLSNVGDGMATASADYIQKRLLQASQQDSQERIHAGNNAATIQAATISAQGRVDAAKARVEAIKRDAKTPTELITRLLQVDPSERGDDWYRAYTEANAAAKAESIRKQQQVAPSMLNNSAVPTVDTANAEAEAAARARSSSPAPVTQQPTTGLTKEQVEAHGGVYEPGYEYALINGQLKRRQVKK